MYTLTVKVTTEDDRGFAGGEFAGEGPEMMAEALRRAADLLDQGYLHGDIAPPGMNGSFDLSRQYNS